MNEPNIQFALPNFSRSMKTLGVLFVGVWLVESLVNRSAAVDTTPDPLGPFTALVLIPSRVAHGEVWRLVTHPFVHDPAGVQSVFWTVITLWFFGGVMETRWGLRRVLTAMAVTSVVSALAVVVVGAIYTPFWTQRAYSPAAATTMLAAAWGMSEGTRATSFLGIVSLTGRQFTAIFGVMIAVGFFFSQSPGSVLALVGLLVGAVLGNGPARRASRPRTESAPKLRVIKGGIDSRDLPN